MTLNNHKKLLVFVLLTFFTLMKAQTTFVVTNTSLGASNSLDVILKEAIISASSGNDVIVSFNAPGLIQINERLTPIMLENGSITFEASAQANVDQGIVYSLPLDNYSISYGLYILENHPSSSISFKNLTIKGFTSNINDTKSTRTGIYIDRGNNIKINNCKFIENRIGIYCTNEGELEITNNQFENNGVVYTGKLDFKSEKIIGAIVFDELQGDIITATSKIYSNTFNTSQGIKIISPAIAINKSAERKITNKLFLIRKNIINDYYTGIVIQNAADYYINPDPRILLDKSFRLTIDSNLMRNAYNIHFVNPFTHFLCNYNDLQVSNEFGQGGSVFIRNTTNTINEMLGINFINTNSINEPIINGSNLFSVQESGNKYYSFMFQGVQNSKITGLLLPASCLVNGDYAGKIRNNKITSSSGIESPIVTINNSENRTPKPFGLNTAIKSELIIDFGIKSQLTEENIPYIADIYTSNPNGDLTDYIGSYEIKEIRNNKFSINIPIPSSPSINNNTRFAISITSMGNQKGTVPIGSSDVGFSAFTPECCIPDFTNTVVGLYPPCDNIIIPFSDKIYIGSTAGSTCVGSEINFDISSFICPIGSSIDYTIDWGDQSPVEIGTTASHIYTSSGIYYMFVNFNDPNNLDCNEQDHNYIFAIDVRNNCCVKANLLTNGMERSEFPVVNCPGQDVSFILGSDDACWFNNFTSSINWTFSDGYTATGPLVQHSFTTSGIYTVTATYSIPTCGTSTYTTTVSINTCELDTCNNCLSSFAPIPGKTYIIGAWVSEDEALPTKTSFDFPQIFIDFTGTTNSTQGPFTASGKIIDGWQRVEQTFTVPLNASSCSIRLVSSQGDCFFDDIRIFPKDGSMKSYVYDPRTLRLMAELDERNYATFYEYDEEGKLSRVKKETERGIMTIKEAKNSIIKREN